MPARGARGPAFPPPRPRRNAIGVRATPVRPYGPCSPRQRPHSTPRTQRSPRTTRFEMKATSSFLTFSAFPAFSALKEVRRGRGARERCAVDVRPVPLGGRRVGRRGPTAVPGSRQGAVAPAARHTPSAYSVGVPGVPQAPGPGFRIVHRPRGVTCGRRCCPPRLPYCVRVRCSRRTPGP
jgi:hypothetical protein